MKYEGQHQEGHGVDIITEAAGKSRTREKLAIRGSYREPGVMDFGLYIIIICKFLRTYFKTSALTYDVAIHCVNDA